MSTNKTTNYNLHSWAAGDDFLRSEFNENFAAIDTAITEKPEIVFGAYIGDGNASQTIFLGKTPKILLTCRGTGEMAWNYGYYGGLAAPGNAVQLNETRPVMEIVTGGFTVYGGQSGANVMGNVNGWKYHYLAVY